MGFYCSLLYFPCSEVHALDLQTLTWRKVNRGSTTGSTACTGSTSGTGSTKPPVPPKAAWHASTQWGSYMVAYAGGLDVWGFDMSREEWFVWKGVWPQDEDAKGMAASHLVLGDHSKCGGTIYEVGVGGVAVLWGVRCGCQRFK
jgi:hypothetical protein